MGDLERAMAAALDPRKLSPASGGAGLGPGGARSAGGPAPGSTAKWQVRVRACSIKPRHEHTVLLCFPPFGGPRFRPSTQMGHDTDALLGRK